MAYNWYSSENSEEILQGDILDSCPIYIVPSDLAVERLDNAEFNVEERDVIIMTQSCDLESNKVAEVLLCPVWKKSEFSSGHLSTDKGLEDVRRGNLPAYHLLHECEIVGLECEFRIVDFRHIYSMPLGFVREFARNAGDRVRLLPPYREHLAQSFARYFMRVGLPVNIPAFVT